MKKLTLILTLFTLFLIAFLGCKKIDHQNELPFVVTGDTSNVQLTTAIVSGSVTPNDAPIQSSGHVWSSINQLPSYSNNEGRTVYTALSLQNKIISNLVNLSAGKTYYVRGYIISGVDTVYGNVVSFSSIGYTALSISTDSVKNVTLTSADVGASVTSFGNSPVTQHGHVWSKTTQTPTTSDSLTALGSLAGPSTYTSSLLNLSPGTIYYVRAYAVNSAGTSYGNAVTITTLSNLPPSLTTDAITNITINSAQAGGSITSTGSSPVSQYGHVWSSTNSLPTINDNKSQLGPAAAPLSFTSSLTGLTTGTTYYVRSYAVNNGGISYGAVVTFTTAAPNNPPAVSTGNVTGITVNSASVGGTISEIGSSGVTQYGHVWSSSNASPTIADNKTQLGTATSPLNFASSLTGLAAGTTYYVRAYAVNNGGTSYGAVVTFTTTAPNNPPVVLTGSVTGITINSAGVGGTISDVGSSGVTQYGHVWSSSNATPTIADNRTLLGTANSPLNFTSPLTGLASGTTYYVRAYAVNNGGITYGAVVTFTTAAPNNPPVVLTGSLTGITINSATVGGTISDVGNSAVTQYGHVWSSSNATPTIADNKTQFGTAIAPLNFSSQLAGLAPSTNYYVRAYATNAAGTTYGAVVTFTTAAPLNNPPSVTIGNISSITVNSATASGNITDIGSSPITQYGHVWSSTNNTPTITDSKTDLGGTSVATSFSSPLTGLQPNTVYYVRAYAVNNGGITYSGVVSFTTGAAPNNPATVTTDSIRQVAQNTATAYGNITGLGNSPVTQYGHVWSSTNSTPTINDNKTQLGAANAPTVFNSTLTGLTSGTTYYVRAYAINSGGISYGQLLSFTTTSSANTLPAVTSGTITSITYNSATAAGNITYVGSSPVTHYGHVWSSSNNIPTTADSKTDLGVTNTVTGFNSSLTGLQPDTYYWVRTYATNSAGTVYGSTVIFNTAKNDPANLFFYVPPANVTATTATFDGKITDIGSSPVTQYGLVWSTNTAPTINDRKTQLGSASGPVNFTSTMTGLTPSTNYYVRAYAINNAGIFYTTQYAFYTAAYYPPPSIGTGSISNITFSTATAAGSITSTNNSSITDYGHVWSSTNNVPTLNDNKTQLGSSSGPVNYTSSLTGLTQGTTYYVRAYAINFGGVAYGNVVTFTTSTNLPPSVTTGDSFYQPPGVANSFVDFPGTINSTGSSAVTQHGHVWSKTNTNPTLSDSFNQLGAASTGTYNSVFSPNVIPPGTYYVRAYATNSAGVSYGLVKTFTY